jgi:hypothetical protein
MKIVRSLILILLVSNSCIDKVELRYPKSQRRVVIEGHLTNENTENYVKLTYSKALGEANDLELAIQDATVIIKDDNNNIDTLEQSLNGYYITKTLICVPKRKYYLSVYVNDTLYTADSRMPPVPTVDSVAVIYVENSISKFSGWQPLLYFKDNPQEKNYYLTKLCYKSNVTNPSTGINCSLNSRIWNFSVLSDDLLDENKEGININVGSTPSSYYVYNLENGEYSARLYSLTRESYIFYKSQIESFKSDGGAYSNYPSTAPTNIKGGAVGFFNTSSVSVRNFIVAK